AKCEQAGGNEGEQQLLDGHMFSWVEGCRERARGPNPGRDIGLRVCCVAPGLVNTKPVAIWRENSLQETELTLWWSPMSSSGLSARAPRPARWGQRAPPLIASHFQ